MIYYFDDKRHVTKLRRILEEWLGTPFRHQCGVKGMGCDCIHLVLRVYEEMGLIRFPSKRMPDYPRDWHLHNTTELLADGIERTMPVDRLEPVNAPMAGDILLSKYGRASSHSGIYCDGYVYQALNGMGVHKIDLNYKPYRNRMTHLYRMKA